MAPFVSEFANYQSFTDPLFLTCQVNFWTKYAPDREIFGPKRGGYAKMHLHKRFFKAPMHHASFFIFGPRGIGKATWVTQNLPNAMIINLLEDESYRTFLANPEHLKALVAGNPHITQYVIDEVQKVPKILDSVHDLIEKVPRKKKWVS